MLEIERKFLIKKLPYAMDDMPEWEIIQGYLKDEDGTPLRIRKKGDMYFKTYKRGTGLVREEIETRIEKTEFETKRALVGKHYLEKTRYDILHGKYKVELDIFHGKLKGLMFAEVEFPSEQEAQDFIIPERFDVELTDIEEAKNSYLAEHGSEALMKKLEK